jgi:ABC-type transport system involved in cytochrome c biogenesis permease subunit
MNWTWFHKLGSPKWFYGISGKMLPWLSVAALLLISVGVVWGLVFAPPDYQQGNSFRIIYIHVPAAMLAQSIYVMLAVCGIVGLVWKMKLADVALQCAAPIGAWMTAVALVTGAIWGKPTWGSWWVWDARLTSMLILLFLYFGAGDCRRDQHPDHQVLGGVVEHPAPGRDLHPHRKTGNACRDVAAFAADGAGFLLFLRRGAVAAHAS